MTNEKIYPEKGNDEFYLSSYIADKIPGFVRNAVLVIPGGGYGEVCAEREDEPIALEFVARGYNAFVLHYSVGNGAVFPKQLREASKAVSYIKSNADKYGIAPDKVFAAGFSAGGHLAACLGTMWDKEEYCGKFEHGANKIAGMMLLYPVISPKFRQKSFENLLNEENPSAKKLDKCDILNYVSEKSCPAFIMHTVNDKQVNVRNSLTWADTLVEKCYNPRITQWTENAVIWAKNIK